MAQKKEKHLKIVERDPYLQPYEAALQGRADYAVNKEKELLGNVQSDKVPSTKALADWASGYLYFGLHHVKGEGRKAKGEWILREWAPNATAIYIKGDMNNWQKDEKYRLQPVVNGVWEIKLPEEAIKHEQLYKKCYT